MLKEYIAIDLETTGLSAKEDKILEVGAVLVRDGQIADTLSFFVDPGRAIPERITQLTGITEDMIAGARSQQEAIRDVAAFCGDLPLLGHNILFDYSFLKRSAVNHGLVFDHMGIDTLKLARIFLPELPSKRLGAVCGYFGIDPGRSHRAADDAISAKYVYDCLAAKFETGNEKAFLPGPLVYQVKREGPITEAQKRYLNDLIKYHKISVDFDPLTLTKNEASRKIDHILLQYGKIRKV